LLVEETEASVFKLVLMILQVKIIGNCLNKINFFRSRKACQKMNINDCNNITIHWVVNSTVLRTAWMLDRVTNGSSTILTVTV